MATSATETEAKPAAPGERTRCLQQLSDRVNGGLEGFYTWLGQVVADHPRRTIAATLFVTACLGLGWMRLEVEDRAEKLYTPQNSEAMDDQDWVDARFGKSVRFVSMYYIADDGADFVDSRDGVRDVFRFYEGVENDVDDGDLGDICIRASNGQCSKQSILGFWNYDLAAFEADADWVGTMSQLEAPDAFSTSEAVVPDNVMGTYERNGAGRLTSVKALRFEWVIEENLVLDVRTESDPVAEDFEEKYNEFTDEFDETFAGEMYPFENWSFEASIAGAFAFDALLTAVSYVLLTVYACVVMSARNKVHSRSNLGIIAVLTVGCSVVSGFGFCLAIGIPFSLVVNTVIFVMLGLGVDDAFVILECLGQVTDPSLSIKTKIGRTLARAGASITLTSVTDFAAFLSGSSTIIPALNNFCIFASVTILFDFIYQVTFFVAFVKYDEERIQDKRADCCCCSSLCCPARCLADAEQMCCSEEKYTHESGRDTFVRRLVTQWMPKVTLHPAGKAFVLLAAAAFVASGIVGILRLELDFQYEWFVPENSEVQDVLDLADDYFTEGGFPVSFYTDDVDYFALQDRLTPFCEDIEATSEVDATSVECWYRAFEEGTGNAGSAAADAAAFYAALDAYTATTQGSRFEDRLLWNDDRSKLVASRITARLVETTSTEEDLDAMDSVRRTADAYDDLGAIAFSSGFVFFEGLAVMYAETVRNVLIALVVVFAMCLIFLADVTAAVLVLLNLGLIDICLLGFIHWWGMHMNMVIAINLLLAIGLTVDYSAHIAHAYMHAAGTRQERAQGALDRIGVSVFNGGITTFIATLPLAFARTYVFQVFFKCFVMIVGFGLFFGVVVLPVVLSLAGPSASYAKEGDHGGKGSYEGVGGSTKANRVADIASTGADEAKGG